MREMLDPAGGFYSTQDADSDGVEGKFFAWTPDEIREVLGDDAQANAFMAAYGVTRHGNASTGSAHSFEGRNILEFVDDMDQRPALAGARRKLLEAREQRVHPGKDDVCRRKRRQQSKAIGLAKVLTSWNGRMLAAFAEAARVLDREDGSRALAASYRLVGERNAEFLLRELRQEKGRLLRTWKHRPERVLEGPVEGAGEAKLNGYLQDYAYLIEGLQELYRTTFDPRWFVAAQELTKTMIERSSASEGVQLARTGQLPSKACGIAGFFDTSDDHETLITGEPARAALAFSLAEALQQAAGLLH